MTESEVRLAILIVAVVIIGSVLAFMGCVVKSSELSRQEEKKDRRILKPCPRCGKPPHLGYACGEYLIYGDDPNCPYCGTAFSEMHSSIDLEIKAWNGRVKKDLCPKCGGELHCDRSVMLTTYPGQYRWECKQCGHFEFRVAEW